MISCGRLLPQLAGAASSFEVSESLGEEAVAVKSWGLAVNSGPGGGSWPPKPGLWPSILAGLGPWGGLGGGCGRQIVGSGRQLWPRGWLVAAKPWPLAVNSGWSEWVNEWASE